MTPVVASLLRRAAAAGVELESRGDRLRWRAPGGLPADLADGLRTHKAELLAVLSSPLSVYRERIARARSWDDLYGVLADAQLGYVNGELSGEEVEELAAVCAQEAHGLPEHADKCCACGQARWWVHPESGRRTCATCHPNPRR